MINYFFFPESYKGIDIAYIKESIDKLNEAMMMKDKNETFYEDSSFYITEYEDKQFLHEKLSKSYKDLTNRVIPSMFRRMKRTSLKVVDDIVTLNAQYPDAWSNCLWGWFNEEDRHHICSFNFFASNRKAIAKNFSTGMNFQETMSLLLDKVQISSNAMGQIRNLGNGDDFKKVLDSICSLDSYNTTSWNTGGFQVNVLLRNYNVTISDESDTVKKKPQLKQKRYFKVSDEIGSQYCFYHVKLNDIRIHIYPDEDKKVIYVAYVGAHLDLG